MANVNRPQFEPGERPPGFRSRRARIGHELGSELIGASLWEVPPGEAAYPDSDKIGIGERLPRGGGLRGFFRRSDGVGYFDGESGPDGGE